MPCAAVLVVGVLAPGCGGDDDEVLTKAEFIQKVNAICEEGDQELQEASSEAFQTAGGPTSEEIAQYANETAIPSIEDQIDEIRALEGPAADQEQINSFLDSAQADLDQVRQDPNFLFSGAFENSSRLAAGYGIRECARE
jgi:hypothetical protein